MFTAEAHWMKTSQWLPKIWNSRTWPKPDFSWGQPFKNIPFICLKKHLSYFHGVFVLLFISKSVRMLNWIRAHHTSSDLIVQHYPNDLSLCSQGITWLLSNIVGFYLTICVWLVYPIDGFTSIYWELYCIVLLSQIKSSCEQWLNDTMDKTLNLLISLTCHNYI